MSTVTVGDSYFQDLYLSIQDDIYSAAKSAKDIQSDFTWSPSMGDVLNTEIFDLLDCRGFVLVSVETNPNIQEVISWQNVFLGPSMKDRGDDRGGYSTVMAEKDGKFFVNSSLSQPIHTDEGHTSRFPRYISLYCETPSLSGGVSTLVSAEAMIEKLKVNFADRIHQLFNRNAIKVKNVGGFETKNILMRLPDGRTGISYSPILRELTCDESIFEMFSNITKYVHNPDNQIRFRLARNHLLIVDNCRVLHGRTRFLASDRRILSRMWFSECRLNSTLASFTV
tara:strand:- start:5887 stop:6732 length:846 start_codon:yes stop_codon:yes gene_type:complete